MTAMKYSVQQRHARRHRVGGGRRAEQVRAEQVRVVRGPAEPLGLRTPCRRLAAALRASAALAIGQLAVPGAAAA